MNVVVIFAVVTDKTMEEEDGEERTIYVRKKNKSS